MEQNKDQGGAAVRGEAVAASNPTDLRLRITEVLMNRANGMSEDHLYFQRAPEDAKRPVSMLIAELVATVVSARAADAPSEPSEQALWDDNGEPMNDAAEKEWRQCNERIRQRAADALDSQPTDQKSAFMTYFCAKFNRPDTLEFDDLSGNELEYYDFWQSAQAISQPTDGGVRNG